MNPTPEVVHLIDATTGHEAKILVSQGFNCYSWTFPGGDEPTELLWASEDHASGQARASSSGIPLLFPFPGRLRGTSLIYRGKTYELEEGDGRGNAIHGFLHTRPWEVVDQSPHRITAKFMSETDPDLATRWPSDFEAEATYELANQQLRFQFKATNTGGETMPFGFGVHPYFRLDVEQVQQGGARIQVPVERQWILHDMLPTGEVVPDPLHLAEGRSLQTLTLDHVFEQGSLPPEQTIWEASVERGDGSAIKLEYGREYPFCVVYTPGHREAVCIEPYTCLPDGLNLTRADQPAAPRWGWQTLEPGETWTTSLVYGLTATA